MSLALLPASALALAPQAPDLEQAAERIIRSLKPLHGNVNVSRSGRCQLKIDRVFSGELATHQQVIVHLDAVTYADTGMTVGPKRNDDTYREIAKHRPHAVFLGSRSAAIVVRTETWFDPNPFRLQRSFVDESVFELYATTREEADALRQAVLALAADCRNQRD